MTDVQPEALSEPVASDDGQPGSSPDTIDDLAPPESDQNQIRGGAAAKPHFFPPGPPS